MKTSSFFRFCTQKSVFYPSKPPVFLRNRCELTDLPIENMRTLLFRIRMGCLLLGFASSAYIIYSYRDKKYVKLLFSSAIFALSCNILLKSFLKLRVFVYKVELCASGRHIFLTQLSNSLRFYEKKVEISQIRAALELRNPNKFHRVGKPFLINNQLFLLPRNLDGKYVKEEYQEILEAILKGQEIFVKA